MYFFALYRLLRFLFDRCFVVVVCCLFLLLFLGGGWVGGSGGLGPEEGGVG